MKTKVKVPATHGRFVILTDHEMISDERHYLNRASLNQAVRDVRRTGERIEVSYSIVGRKDNYFCPCLGIVRLRDNKLSIGCYKFSVASTKRILKWLDLNR